MKFFHIADLHLGRSLHQYSLLEDQRFYLDFLLAQIDLHKPDALVIAGDVYDRAVPSAESTELLDYFLTELSRRKLTVLIIAGNHDSAVRLNYASKLLSAYDIHLVTEYQGQVPTVTLDLEDKYHFHLLPFFKPAQVRRFHPDTELSNYEQALQTILTRVDLSQPGRHILVAHQFFLDQNAAAITSESEQIFIGGLDQISASLLSDFDYVALGHLHQPHFVQKENIRYSGSPLVYSASELARPKFLSLVEFQPEQDFSLEKIEFTPLRDVVIKQGLFADLIDEAKAKPSEAYVYLRLLDQQAIIDVALLFKQYYPNLLEVRFPKLERHNNTYNPLQKAPSQLDLNQLFALFYQEEMETELPKEDLELIEQLTKDLR